jgi:hypothetical protein
MFNIITVCINELLQIQLPFFDNGHAQQKPLLLQQQLQLSTRQKMHKALDILLSQL